MTAKQQKQNSFTLADVGASISFNHFDGSICSGKIIGVHIGGGEAVVRIALFLSRTPTFVSVVKDDWHRITRFGDAKFLVVEPASFVGGAL